MTTASWRKAHWIAGVVALALFLLSGAYMRWVHEPSVGTLSDDAIRAVYRSRHLWLLWASLVNLAMAGEAKGRAGRFVSGVVLAAPAILLGAFLTEPEQGVQGRTFSRPILYLLFLCAVILAVTNRSAKSGSSTRGPSPI